MTIARRLKSLLGMRARDPESSLAAQVAALTAEVRALEDRHERRLRDLCASADSLAGDLARAKQELAEALARHAALHDEYRALTRARDRLARQYRGLAAQHPGRASPPPTAQGMAAGEAYDTFADFVEFCKHVGVRPPEALPDYMA